MLFELSCYNRSPSFRSNVSPIRAIHQTQSLRVSEKKTPQSDRSSLSESCDDKSVLLTRGWMQHELTQSNVYREREKTRRMQRHHSSVNVSPPAALPRPRETPITAGIIAHSDNGRLISSSSLRCTLHRESVVLTSIHLLVQL